MIDSSINISFQMIYWFMLAVVFISNTHAQSHLSNQDEEDLLGSLVAFDTAAENYTVPISGKCVLTCYVAEVRSFKVLWQKIDRPLPGTNQTHGQEQLTLIAFDGIVYSNKDHYRLESDYVGSYNLIIDRVNEDDQGEYQCQINTEPRKTKRIFLTVQVPPHILDFRPNPPLLSVPSGASLTLLCRAEGTPTPRIRWRSRDTDQHLIDLLPPDNSNIWFIPSISRLFPRTVECIADNGVLPASNRIFTIHVEYSPIVSVKNDLIPTERYQNVTLECSISSRPMARTYWEKDGQRLTENQIIHTRINQTMSIHRLRIQMNDDDDFGQYTCVAENAHGRTEGIVFVLQESTVPSTLSTTVITPRKSPRYSRYSSSRENSTRTHLETSISTITYVEREIRLSSSASRLWLSSLWIFLGVRLKDLQR